GVVENVQNFMEYAYCSTMFTAGQRNRMHAALNSSTAGRSNLWSLGNLLATGTDHLTYAGCAPKPVLSPALTHFVCAGDTVFFDHFNTHGTATAWDWSFDGGTPAASSDSSVYSIYNAPGSYNVSLTTSNAAGSNGTTLLNYVQTLPATAHHPASGFVENFEGFSFAGSNWVVINPEGSGWTHTTNAGFSGNSSLRLSTAGQLENIPDHFITPTYDLSTVSDLTLYFRVAYAQREDGDIDNLRVYASTDCGQSWKLRYSKTGPTLSTTDDPVGGTFVPTASQWRQEAVNLNALAGETNVRFRFEFTNKGGNNVYIDDINFNPTTTVQDTRSELSLSVFPNPASGNDVALSFNLGQPADHASVTLVSAEGRTTEVMPPTRLDAGHHLLRLALNNVPAGYYMLWLRDGEKSWSSPVVIKR
ncbi:MAG TPA: PKD domain-containing protein, partial [Chitinophagales bacterium]|nr:PKD domain-containing protein [Chitinophagales bacterium]